MREDVEEDLRGLAGRQLELGRLLVGADGKQPCGQARAERPAPGGGATADHLPPARADVGEALAQQLFGLGVDPVLMPPPRG
jgi:hypothetical protein